MLRHRFVREGKGTFGFRIRQASNTVEVLRHVNQKRPDFLEFQSDMKAEYGSIVTVSAGVLEAHHDACDWHDRCDPPLRGALKIRKGNGTPCSSAFILSATGETASHYQVASAGHCARPGDTYDGYLASGQLRRIGTVQSSWDGGAVDGLYLSIDDETYWDPRPWIYHDFFRPKVVVREKTSSSSALPEGYVICRNGYASAVQCGQIISTSSFPSTEDRIGSFFGFAGANMQMLEADYCSAAGDSGGAVYDWWPNPNGGYSAMAVGIHSSSGGNETCLDDEHSFASHISYFESMFKRYVRCPEACILR